MLTIEHAPGFRNSHFSAGTGFSKYFFVIESESQTSASEALEQVHIRYAAALQKHGLSEQTAVFARIYLSDIENQKSICFSSALLQSLRGAAVSIVGQIPLCGGSAALQAYHVARAGKGAMRDAVAAGGSSDVLLRGDYYAMLFSASHSGAASLPDSYAQTKALFEALALKIEASGTNMLGGAIRTWIFVRDVDNNYKGMVKARKEFFAAKGLTEKSRFLASTGIEGQSPSVHSLVTIDALAYAGLHPSQIVRMEAPAHMSPTIDYGVTFERGVRVRFGDRSHLYISGTASIDTKGEVLFPGDVCRQTQRMIENIEALLGEQAASLDDLCYLVVYLRDPNSRNRVLEGIRSKIRPHLPVLLLQGAVCRPAWLVEAEGIAIRGDRTDFPPFL